MRVKLLLLMVFTAWVGVCAQTSTNFPERCATQDWHDMMYSSSEEYANKHDQKMQDRAEMVLNWDLAKSSSACPNGSFNVPVAVHFDGGIGANASEHACLLQLVDTQIAALNTAYNGTSGAGAANSCLNFVLATQNHPAGYSLVSGEPAVTFNGDSGCSSFDPCTLNDFSGYMNIYVHNGNGILGVSCLGGDGAGGAGCNTFAVGSCAFGTNAVSCANAGPNSGCGANWQYTGGATTVHEAGHFLTLEHTFCADGALSGTSSCTGGGGTNCDGFSDTQDQAWSVYGCPGGSASGTVNNPCTSMPYAFNNFMDYVDDACMDRFSEQQTTAVNNHMNSTFGTYDQSKIIACTAITLDSESATCDAGDATFTATVNYTISAAGNYTVTASNGTPAGDVTVSGTGSYTATVQVASGSSTQLTITDDTSASCFESTGVLVQNCSPCTQNTDGPYGNLIDLVGDGVSMCGSNCGQSQIIDGFAVWAGELYVTDTLLAGAYTIDICTGVGAGSFAPDLVITTVADPSTVVANSGGNCSVTFNASGNDDYSIFIQDATDTDCPQTVDMVDNGFLQITSDLADCPVCPTCDVIPSFVDVSDNSLASEPAIICPDFESIPANVGDVCVAVAALGEPDGVTLGITSTVGTIFDSSAAPAVSTEVSEGIIAFVCFSQADIDAGTTTITYTYDGTACANTIDINWSAVAGSDDIAANFCACVIEDGVDAGADFTACTGQAIAGETIQLTAVLGDVPAVGAASLEAAVPISLAGTDGATCSGSGDINSIPLTNVGTVGANLTATGNGSISQLCVTIPTDGVSSFNDSYAISMTYSDGTSNFVESLYLGSVFTGGCDAQIFPDPNTNEPLDVCWIQGTPGYTVTSGGLTTACAAGSETFDGTFDGDDSTVGNWLGQDPDVAGSWSLFIQDVNCFFGDSPSTLTAFSLDFDTGASGATDCTLTEWLDPNGASIGTSNPLDLDLSPFTTPGDYNFTAVADCAGAPCEDIITITIEENLNPGDADEANTFSDPLFVCSEDEFIALNSTGEGSLTADQVIVWAYWVLEDPLENTAIPAADVPGGAQATYASSDANFDGFFAGDGTTGPGEVMLPVEATGATYYVAPMIFDTNTGLEVCSDVGDGVYMVQYAALGVVFEYDYCTDELILSLSGGEPAFNAAASYNLSVLDGDGQEIALDLTPALADSPVAIATVPGDFTITLGDNSDSSDATDCEFSGVITIDPSCLITSPIDKGDAPGGIVSNNYIGITDTLVQSADDFATLTPMTIAGVSVIGSPGAGTPNIMDWNVEIYENNFGVPGAVVCSNLGMTPTDPTNYSPVLTLASPCMLSAGSYWVSVWGSADVSNGDARFNWSAAATSTGAQAVLVDSGDFFGAGATSWTNINTLIGETTHDDLAFTLYTPSSAGDAVAVEDNSLCCDESLIVMNSGAETTCTSLLIAWALTESNDEAGVLAAIAAGDVDFADTDNSYTFSYDCNQTDPGTYFLVPFLADNRSSTPAILPGCTDYGTGIEIVLGEAPALALSNAQCSGDMLTYSVDVTVTDGTAPYTLDTGGDGTVTDNGGGSFTISEITITVDPLTVSATGDDDCESVEETIAAPVCACPTVNDPTIDEVSAVCEGADLPTLSATADAGLTIDWFSVATDGSSLSTGDSYTPTMAGTYYAEASNENGCTSDRASVEILVFDLPTADAGTTQTVDCINTMATLDGSASDAGLDYSWSGPNGFSETTITAVATEPGTYTLTVLNTATDCSNSATVEVTSNIAAPTADAGNDRVISCGNPDVTLNGSDSDAGDYEWTDGDGNVVSINDTYIALAPGTYTLTVTGANGCTDSDEAVVSGTLDAPDLEAGADGVLDCANSSVNLTASSTVSGVTFAWTGPNGFDEAGATVVASEAGTYTVIATDPSDCTATTTVDVDSNSTTPDLDASGGGEITCTTVFFTLTATSTTANATFEWLDAAGVSLGTGATYDAELAGDYTVEVTDPATGCTADQVISVTENAAAPDANAGNGGVLTCANTSVSLTGSSTTAGATFAWSGPNDFSTTGAMASATEEGTYTLTVTDPANGCTETATVSVTEDVAAPTADAGNVQTLTCAIVEVTLDGSASTAGMDYSWTNSDGAEVSTDATASVITTGIYTLTVTDPTNGCFATATVAVSQDLAAPTADAGDDATLTCTTTSATLGGASTAGMEYSWTNSGGSEIGTEASVIVSASGTYTITVTDPANGCSDSNDVVVDQSADVPVADAGDSQSLTCDVSTVILDGSASSAGVSYAWTDPAGAAAGSTATISVTVAGNYMLTVTNTASGCFAEAVVSVTDDSAAPTADAGTAITVTCSNPDISLDGSGSEAGLSYAWSGPNNYASSDQVATISNAAAMMAGTYTLTVANEATGCSDSATVEVSFDTTAPTVDVSASALTIDCNTASASLDASGSTGGDSYSWADAVGAVISTDALTTVGTAGDYTVTITNSANGCSAQAVVTVVVDLAAPVADAGTGGQLDCSATSVTLDGSASDTGMNYNWTLNGNSVSTAVSFAAEEAGIYTLNVTNPSNGCSATDEVVVTISTDLPTADAGPNGELTCAVESVTLNGSGSDSGLDYSWTNGDGIEIATSLTVAVNAADTYTLTVSDAATGCSSTSTTVVTGNTSAPDVTIAGGSVSCETPTVTLTAVSANAVSYAWTDAVGNDLGTATEISVSAIGTYTVSIIGANACTAVADFDLTGECDPGCLAEAASISTTDATTICAGDGVADPINVSVDGGVGASTAWVITDDALNILALPEAGPFDLDGAGFGTCIIWLVNYDDLAGAEVGMNAANLSGCYALSNGIEVTREDCTDPCQVSAATISTTDATTICAGDGVADPINVSVDGGVGASTAWVITDDALNILALPEAGPFDLDGAGFGTCIIWLVNYDDLAGAEVGMNAANLSGCYALSNGIEVTREDCTDPCQVSAASISTTDATTICAGDGVADPINVSVDGGVGASTAWVITDDALNILALPEAGPFDLDGAGFGTCIIWLVNYDDLAGAEVGMNAANLSGCYALSNGIEVTREDCTDPCQVSAASISTTDATTICAGDGVADPINVSVEGGVGASTAWVITDDALNILALPEAGPFDLDGAGFGTCIIWLVNYDDLAGAEVGMNAANLSGCYALSNGIEVTREDCTDPCQVSAATISTTDATTICAGDGVADPINVSVDGGVGASTAWVITDDALNILALPEAGPFDLDGAGFGTCIIWLVNYDDLAGAEVGMNAANLSGCYALSNGIEVTREDCTVADTYDLLTTLYIDLNANGQQDSGEAGLANVLLTLTAANGATYTGTTDSNGALIVAVTEEGEYSFALGLPAGFEFSDGAFNGTGSVSISGDLSYLSDGFGGQDIGAFSTVDACSDFAATQAAICSANKSQYDVLLVFQGGDPGANGYDITNNNTGVVIENYQDGTIILGPFSDGTGYSFTVSPSNHPECFLVFSESLVDCITTSIELIDFAGSIEKEGNSLTWSTASENETDYFIVEGSRTGDSFTEIGKVNAVGNSNTVQGYSLMDVNASAGVTYYRLVEVNAEGIAKVVSAVIALDRSEPELNVTAFPNPVIDVMTIELEAMEAGSAAVQVLDITGRIILTETVAVIESMNSFTIDLENVPAGTFILQVTMNDAISTTRLIKE